MTSKDYSELGQWLRAEHRSGARFVSFAPERGITGLADAYDAQDAHIAAMQADGLGEVIGWKIGLTSKRMQEMCGIDQPVAGAILSSRSHPSGARIRTAEHGRLGLEFEVCIRLGADLPARNDPYTLREVTAAAETVAAAIELVDDRNCDYATLAVESLIADNSWNAGVVIGNWARVPPTLADCEGVVKRDGEKLDSGFGRDVLGGPMIPLEWLANHLSARGRGLRRGDIVMTGSLIQTQVPKGPCRYEFHISGVGSVTLLIEG